jgi:hypothetical protein
MVFAAGRLEARMSADNLLASLSSACIARTSKPDEIAAPGINALFR